VNELIADIKTASNLGDALEIDRNVTIFSSGAVLRNKNGKWTDAARRRVSGNTVDSGTRATVSAPGEYFSARLNWARQPQRWPGSHGAVRRVSKNQRHQQNRSTFDPTRTSHDPL